MFVVQKSNPQKSIDQQMFTEVLEGIDEARMEAAINLFNYLISRLEFLENRAAANEEGLLAVLSILNQGWSRTQPGSSPDSRLSQTSESGSYERASLFPSESGQA